MPSSLINQFSLLQPKHTLTTKINSKANEKYKNYFKNFQLSGVFFALTFL